MATLTSQLIEQRLPDNGQGLIAPADVRAVAHALDAQAPNQRRGGPFLVSYLTQPPGQLAASCLDQLDPALLCLGATARVQHHPDGAGRLLVLVPALVPEAGMLSVAVDGDFGPAHVPATWTALDSTAAAAANVPPYAGNVAYQVDDLVRYHPAGQPEAFYYALATGHLPAPTGQDDDASWQVVPGPVAPAVLSQALSLPQARGLAAQAESADGGVVAGRQYAIALGLGRVYYVEGLAGRFDGEGTLVAGDGTRTRGTLDLASGAFTPRAAGGNLLSFQVTASSFAGFADMLLTNPAARLDALDPFFNAAGVQGQLLLLSGQPYRAYSDAAGAVATLNGHLGAFWAEFGASGRVLLRLRVVPASPAIVAHAQVFFTQPPALTPQPLHPHNSGFRLYGTQFALSPYDWNHLQGCLASGGTLSSNANYGNATATGSPSFGNSGSGLRALFTARHNQANSYDLLGFTASSAPNPNGANFAAAFHLYQGAMVWAMRGATKVAELPYTGELLTLELWDDGIRWYVGSTLLFYDPTPPAEANLHLGATFHTDQAAWLDVQAGGQTANPR